MKKIDQIINQRYKGTFHNLPQQGTSWEGCVYIIMLPKHNEVSKWGME